MYRRSLRKVPRKIRKLVAREIKDDLQEIFDRMNRSRETREYEQSHRLMFR